MPQTYHRAVSGTSGYGPRSGVWRLAGNGANASLVTASVGDRAMLAARARQVDALLSRFPGPVTLAVRRSRWLGVLAIAVDFVLACVFILCGDLGIDEASARSMAWA